MNFTRFRTRKFWLTCLKYCALAVAGYYLLIGLLLVGFNLSVRAEFHADARNDTLNLSKAVTFYHKFCNRFPGEPEGFIGRDYSVLTTRDTAIIGNLIGYNHQKVIFLNDVTRQFDKTNHGEGGLHIHNYSEVSLLDPWGNPYLVTVDADHDGSIVESCGDQTIASKGISGLAQVRSFGPDGEFGTRDDIVNAPWP